MDDLSVDREIEARVVIYRSGVLKCMLCYAEPCGPEVYVQKNEVLGPPGICVWLPLPLKALCE